MQQTRDRYPDLLVLRSAADFDGYDDATEAFRRGGSQRDLMTRLMKLGMTAAQVKASCWGPPLFVNAKMRKTGKYEQYVYGDNKSVSLRDGIVTSVSIKVAVMIRINYSAE